MTFAGHANIQLTYNTYGHMFPDPADHHAAMTEVEDGVVRLMQQSDNRIG